jgi:hypothetical protein
MKELPRIEKHDWSCMLKERLLVRVTRVTRHCSSRPDKTKAPRMLGRFQNSTAGASGCDLGRLYLEELAGTYDRDSPRLHGLRNLSHEVHV